MKLSDYIGRYWASAEVMYAIIIAMTFTSTLRGTVATVGTFYYTVVYSALFCCVAWGIADGSFYAWERSYNARMENEIIEYSKLDNDEAAISLIKEELDDTILRNIDENDREKLYQKLVEYLSEAGIKRKPSTRDAFNIVLGTFLASSAAGLIVVAPFFLIENVRTALNISNILGISLLFIIGYNRASERGLFARVTLGFGTAIIGIIIAVITTLLGG